MTLTTTYRGILACFIGLDNVQCLIETPAYYGKVSIAPSCINSALLGELSK